MNEQVVIVGAGGHAKVVIELLQASGNEVAYCIANEASPATCVGVPVLKGDAQILALRRQGYSRVFIAIGANALRRELAEEAMQSGYDLVNAISPAAVISPTVRLGRGIAIMGGAVLNAESVVEDFAVINTGATVDHDCHIGVSAHVGPQCALAGNVHIGPNALIGVGCKLIPGVHVGKNAVVGAGAVVVSNIPEDCLAVGVPARVIKQHASREAVR